MSNQSKTVLIFAGAGLLVAVACGMYAALVDYSTSSHGLGLTLAVISVILCPPQLLFGFCIDCEVTGWGGVIMYSIIGVLNVALYALVGFMFVKLRKPSSGKNSNV